MPRQTATTPVKALVVITYVVMITTNALANALPINGRTTGEISDTYENLFAPAGLTFSIWGVIYLLLAAHVLYQLGLLHDREDRDQDVSRAVLLQRVAVLFSVSSLANAAWIVTWHYDLIGVSVLLLATMLVLLILITRTINAATLSAREQLLVRLPFSVYFGWLTVATIANITVWLVSIGWDGLGLSEASWAVAIIAVGAVIGVTTTLRDRDVAYALVLAWAYLGIWIRQTSPDGFQGGYPIVATTAVVGIAAFLVAAAVTAVRHFTARPTATA